MNVGIDLGLSPLSKHLVVIASVLTIVAVAVAVMSGNLVTTYEKFDLVEVEDDGEMVECERYHASCGCFGVLTVMDSYPPQYDCGGVEQCRSINETVCNQTP